ncbi:hypothetical protein RJT34_11194 [Clitoria ternatea]|uniref:SHSP domain-containing protein n=1 Tax=Clitoria ternatea TaxID=43366 RepID=A0AAN9PI78_CLITE
MATKLADSVYEDFEPYYEWARDQGVFTVILPGFTRDQLKVQVTSKPALRIMGEQPVPQNRRRRFYLELPIPSDYDRDNVSAKFETGKLSVKFGKLTKPGETTPKETPRPKEPSPKVDQQKGAPGDTPKGNEDKTESKINNSNEVSDQKKGETKTETTDNTGKLTNGTTEAPKPKVAKPVSRSKTRLIDFSLSSRISDEALGELDTGRKMWRRVAKWTLLILTAVGLGLTARYAWSLRSSHEHGESSLQDL